MSERVVGVGLPVTVSGLNVVFAADDIDSEYYALLTTSHYVYNITRNDTQLITALSGTEAGGYTLAVAAAVGWVTGDYCVPCVTNDKLQYNTPALAIAASAAADRLLVSYARAVNKGTMHPLFKCGALLLNVWGLLANGRTVIGGASTNNCVNIAGDLSGQAQVTIRNVRLASSLSGVYYEDTGVGLTGGGVILDRSAIRGMYGNGFRMVTGGANVCVVQRCSMEECHNGILCQGAAMKVYNATIVRCTNYGIYNTNRASTIKNVFARECIAGDFGGLTSATVTYCADSDGSLPAATGNQNYVTRAQAKLWEDNDNHFYAAGGRILSTSVLAGAGDYQAGQPTTDIDGNDISTGCPIGCHKGTANAFGVSWPDADEVDPLASAFQTFAASVTPAMDVPTQANVRTTDTLRGVPGTCTVPAAGDLKSGVQCGAGGTEVIGTRTDCAAANARFGSGTFGDPGAPITPTCKVPAKADVRLGVAVDVSDTGLINVPTAAQTLVGTPVDQTTGTLQPRVLISESIEEV